MSYADAINAAIEQESRQAIEQARDYGRLIAQACMELSDPDLSSFGPLKTYVLQGYAEQLDDFPEG